MHDESEMMSSMEEGAHDHSDPLQQAELWAAAASAARLVPAPADGATKSPLPNLAQMFRAVRAVFRAGGRRHAAAP